MTDQFTGREPALPLDDGLTGREPFIGGDTSLVQALFQLDDVDFASPEVLAARLAGTLSQLAAMLQDEEERKRSQAARLIGMVAAHHPSSRDQSVPLLVGLLDDAIQHHDWPRALTTIDYLGGTAHPLAAEALSRVLSSTFDISYRLSERAYRAMVHLGVMAVPILTHAASQGFGEEYLDTRYGRLVDAITSICRANPEAIPQVTEWLAPWILNRRIRPSYEIGKLIRRIRPTSWIEPMITVADDRAADIPARLYAARVLHYIGDPMATATMFGFLEEDDQRLHWQAVHSLKAIRIREDIPKIIALIRSSDPRTRRNGLIIAGRRGLKTAVPSIIEALSDGQAATRRLAVAALLRIQDVSTVSALCGMINDRAKPVRREAVGGLSRLQRYFPERQEEIAAALRKASIDPDEQIGQIAASTLRRLGLSLEAS
jgi:HEAT repeat protein